MESRNWIGGEWTTPVGGTQVVRNPSNIAEEVGVVHLSTASDALQAGDAARLALSRWAGFTGMQRGEYLFKAAAILEARADEVARLACLEMGKPIAEMRGEVVRGVNLLRYYAAEGARPNGAVIPSSQADVHQFAKRVPLGVVAIITPWNFPVAIPIWKIAPALICGNTVLWKPAEIASLTATRIAEVFAEAGLPDGVLNLVIGRGRTVGNAVLEKVELDGVSFTGSTETGKSVAIACAHRNIKYQTEMGGKNAAVVLRDADLAKAVPAILSGAFRSAGQKCTATSRIIVEREIYADLVAELGTALSALRVGPALDPASYLGPVASADQHRTVVRYAQMAESEAQVVATGQMSVDPSTGHYVRPMVVAGVDADHPLVQEEIFGPIAALLPADSFEEAVVLCNRTVYGLSASVFTQNLSRAMQFLEEAEAGMVRVNQETAGVEFQAPFGGMKWSSSHTREQGQAALEFFSQWKTCTVYYG